VTWHTIPVLAFDTETTGVSIETDRIVSAAAIHMADGHADTTEWLADPGIDIPAEATAVHGITSEHARGWDEEAAHGAAYDALMAGRIAWRIGRIASLPRAERPAWIKRIHPQRFDRLRGHDLDTLHAAQIIWAQADAASYQQWLRNPEKAGEKYDPSAVIDGTWPLIPLPAADAEPDTEAVSTP
jgi:hypothetical protein